MHKTTKKPVKLTRKFDFGTLALVLIWPFAGFLSSINNFRSSQWKTAFWLFCVYFGFTFIYEDPLSEKFGTDSASYAAALISLNRHPFVLSDIISTFYNSNNGSIDVYQPLATWLVSIFTGDPRFLFAVFAAVFGYFYAQNLWIIYSRINKNVGVLLFLFMLMYAFVNPLWNINGVRMWTAAHVFIYGILSYFLNGNKKSLIWSLSSILFHFSFLFPVVILILWHFIPKKISIALIFFLVTALIDEIDLLKVRSGLSFLPEIVQPRVTVYTDQTYAEGLSIAMGELRWHVKTASVFSSLIIYIWIIILYIKRKNWLKFNPVYEKLFLFALFLGGFAHLSANLPSGSRFLVLSDMLFYAVFLLVLGESRISLYRIQFFKNFTIPLLVFLVIFKIRMGFDYIGILLFFGNPIATFFIDTQTPIIVFVKQLFE